jgi:hypothetical protein
MNVGSDVQAWFTLLKVVVLLALAGWMVPDIIYLVKNKGPREKKVRNLSLKIVALCLAALALFVFFGAGQVTPEVEAVEDGHRKILEARPEPTPESAIKEEAKAKKDPYLKAVDDGPEADRKAADEYIKKALERNKP